jgi:hypothetical protein
MSSQRGPRFDSSFAALALIDPRNGAEQRSTVRTLGLARPLRAGSATAMPIQFAPEPGPTAHVVDLGEDQTTGPLPLGFQFDFFGVRYSWFDLSSDGFMTFGTHWSPFIPLNDDLNNFLALGWTDVCPLGRRHVAYEVRGAAQRRRLVLSLSGVPASPKDGSGRMTAQLVLHERTGMIDVYGTRRDPGAHTVNQEAVRFTTAPWCAGSCGQLDTWAG